MHRRSTESWIRRTSFRPKRYSNTGTRSSQYSTGRALWNIASVETLELGRVSIPRGESSFKRGETAKEMVFGVGRGYHALRMYQIIPSGKVGRSMELTMVKST